MAKTPKRQKPTKTKVKQWLHAHKHEVKPNKAGDYLDVVAEYHGVDADELRKLIKVEVT